MRPATASTVYGMSPNPDDRDLERDEARISRPPPFEADLLALMPGLRRYSRSLSRSDADGEDLLQDCVERALSRKNAWRGVNLKAWLYAIMTNLHRNAHRRARRRPTAALSEAEDLAATTPETDPIAGRRLRAALHALPSDYRAVLMLVVVEGLGYQEVADTLQLPIGTVMSRLSRARARLRDALAENVIPLRRPK